MYFPSQPPCTSFNSPRLVLRANSPRLFLLLNPLVFYFFLISLVLLLRNTIFRLVYSAPPPRHPLLCTSLLADFARATDPQQPLLGVLAQRPRHRGSQSSPGLGRPGPGLPPVRSGSARCCGGPGHRPCQDTRAGGQAGCAAARGDYLALSLVLHIYSSLVHDLINDAALDISCCIG